MLGGERIYPGGKKYPSALERGCHSGGGGTRSEKGGFCLTGALRALKGGKRSSLTNPRKMGTA